MKWIIIYSLVNTNNKGEWIEIKQMYFLVNYIHNQLINPNIFISSVARR